MRLKEDLGADVKVSPPAPPTPSASRPAGFLTKLDQATNKIGQENFLLPPKSKAFLEANPGALVLDVQDPGSDTIPGAYQVSLGTLFFKASTDIPDFKDPKIADLPKDHPIIVTCALGGQAKIGAAILVDYGFTGVKVSALTIPQLCAPRMKVIVRPAHVTDAGRGVGGGDRGPHFVTVPINVQFVNV